MPWYKNFSESEDEGYTAPPIKVKSDDSSSDESESDGSDSEIMEDYDEQLQDNYEMHVIDDSDDSSGEEEVDDDESSGEEDEDDEADISQA